MVKLNFPPLPCLSEAAEVGPKLHYLHYYIALPRKFGSILIILLNKNRLLRVISISQNELRLLLFQHKLPTKILSVFNCPLWSKTYS